MKVGFSTVYNNSYCTFTLLSDFKGRREIQRNKKLGFANTYWITIAQWSLFHMLNHFTRVTHFFANSDPCVTIEKRLQRALKDL